ncbi:MAG: precorrin-3B C(17)-methyltransferase [Victivallales bacterium]|nr:precorrin-3B C(17)-methyltransferase [Victivallales bacterium]
MSDKKIYAVGLGPGAENMITPQVLEILKNCEVIAGYEYYLSLVPEIVRSGKTIISSGMAGEIQRCRKALEAAEKGQRVAVVSSGDAGIYGMAGLLLEIAAKEFPEITVETISGITAASSAAALLGAPLMNDFVVISLSNLMTPESVIVKRLEKAAEADLVCVLYNPAGKKRRILLEQAVSIYSHNIGGNTPAGIVTDACRPEQKITICRLDEFPFEQVNMKSLVLFGNSCTVIRNNKIYTLRGYNDKYEI